jgi:Tfp pilus assembly protein PilF
VTAADASPKPGPRVIKWIGYGTAVLTLFFGVSQVWKSISSHFQRQRQVQELVDASAIQLSAADYRGAWETLEKAANADADAVLKHQQDAAMLWLRNIRVRNSETFTDIIKILSPVLSRGVTQSEGTRKADLLAHLGLADFLRFREGDSQARPDHNYDEALKADPSNVFAHTFKAHWIQWNGGPMSEAATHFRTALDSGRERQFVRQYQFSALFNSRREEDQAELLRTAAEMVRNSEPVSADTQRRLFSETYWTSRNDEKLRRVFLDALNPEEHLRMFQTFYGPGADPTRYSGNEDVRDFWLAALFERSGKPSEALDRYRELQKRIDVRVRRGETYRQNFIRAAEAAINRLSTNSSTR